LTEKLTEKLTNLTKSDEKSTENGTPVPPEEFPAVATSKKEILSGGTPPRRRQITDDA